MNVVTDYRCGYLHCASACRPQTRYCTVYFSSK